MRHAVRGRKLGRTSSHREALFRNQLQSLVDHGADRHHPAQGQGAAADRREGDHPRQARHRCTTAAGCCAGCSSAIWSRSCSTTSRRASRSGRAATCGSSSWDPVRVTAPRWRCSSWSSASPSAAAEPSRRGEEGQEGRPRRSSRRRRPSPRRSAKARPRRPSPRRRRRRAPKKADDQEEGEPAGPALRGRAADALQSSGVRPNGRRPRRPFVFPVESSPRVRLRLGRNVLALAAVSFLTDVASDMTYPLLPALPGDRAGGERHGGRGHRGGGRVRRRRCSSWRAAGCRTGCRAASRWCSPATRSPRLIRPLIGLAQSASQVLAIRVTDRIGKGIRGAPRDALIADSVDPAIRGRAFGFHRAADHAGAVVGPLLAFALLQLGGPRAADASSCSPRSPGPWRWRCSSSASGRCPRASVPEKTRQGLDLRAPLGRRFWAYLGVLLLFTLGNSTDAFLLLRARTARGRRRR